ncbi:RING finger domain protein [Mycena sanguinolenta]|uniref:RING finger domain protein n=1 Tax=Mycena sanguinolenta TaxID=230812 RepID=A0A8H7CJK1_9AGAR|nr:RING finger domain protein [Mycena sanguinolenta]
MTPHDDIRAALSSQFIATLGASSYGLHSTKSWPTRLHQSPHTVLCTADYPAPLAREAPFISAYPPPGSSHSLQILSIPRPNADFWPVLERLLPRLPALRAVRARDVRWLRKGIGTSAQAVEGTSFCKTQSLTQEDPYPMPNATTTPAAAPLTPRRASKMASNQSLNHLLNFTLPPRQTQPPPSLPRRSRKTGTHQGVWNKERFVNAQYRFVMNPNGDYTVHFADPDMRVFFQWQDILQVIIPRSSALASASEHTGSTEGLTTCPICLSPADRPAHDKVFCFPCVLHYLNTSENKWARCPICFDSVNEKQLKSVKWYDGPLHVEEDADVAGSSSSGSALDNLFETAPRAGSMMRMRLMQRPQITTLALPRSHTWPSDLLPPHQAPFHFLPDVFDYAKFMLASPSYLVTDLTQDLNELASERRILTGMTDDLSVLFVDAADEKVRHQIEKATALETPFLRERIDKAIRDQREIEERVAFHENRRKQEGSLYPPDAPQELLSLRSPSTPEPRTKRRNVNPPPAVHILLAHFSSYAAFPDAITVRVDAVSEGTVNDDLRKRCKYLAHMPDGADVVFIEADLSGVVGPGGLKNFEGALKMRAARRKEKGRKDERARVRAEEREREREVFAVSAQAQAPSATWRFAGESPALDEVILPAQPAPPEGQASGGAWGARSFAAALHSAAPTTSQGQGGQSVSRRPEAAQEDEWDMDAAWHELEAKSGGGGKRRNKLVVLGSGGGGRRRR